MSTPIPLSEDHAVASLVPSRSGVIKIRLSGPAVGTWALEHEHDDLTSLGFFVAGSRPEFTVRTSGHLRYGPVTLDGSIELGCVVDKRDFANSFDAVQVAIERMAALPDIEHLAQASLQIEVEVDQ